jgi:hypothetical protein
MSSTSNLPSPRTTRWLLAALLAIIALVCLLRRAAIGAGDDIPRSRRGSSSSGSGGAAEPLFGGNGLSNVLGGRGEMIHHLVLLEFKQHATPMAISRATADLLELKTLCVHPLTQKPYIRGIKGGRDHSPEGLQRGMTHAFILEFDSVEDRNYYVEEDPAHIAFQDRIKPVVEGVLVLDFTPGKFI